MLLLKECSDSTGNILAENGNGKWITWDENFKKIKEEGQIQNGYKEGIWRGKINDTVDLFTEYKNGKSMANGNFFKSGNKTYTSVQFVPQFPGGLDAFGKFLAKNISYPASARGNGIQGRVIISFIVESDGTLSDVKIARGFSADCDKEALRVIKMCPKWIPGMQNGIPVRVAYSVPISFTIGR